MVGRRSESERRGHRALITPEQRAWMREVFYQFEGQILDVRGIEPQRLTDYYIDLIVKIYETGEPYP